MERKKILSALVAGLVFGSMVAEPIASYAAEAANGSEKVLNVKSTAETYREQGEKLYNEGKYEEAATAYEKAAKEEKSNDEYWFMCGLSYYMANSYQKATDYFEKAIELNPSNADSYLFCGHSWLLRGLNSVQDGSRKIGFGKPIWDFFKNACKYADRAVELAPNASSTQCMAGQIAAMSGNMAKKIGFDSYFVNEFYQKAYNRYRKAIELDPNNNLAQKGFSEFIQNHPEYGSMPSAPSVQGGAGTQTVTANGDYGFVQTLGNGPVQYSARMIHTPPTPYVQNDGITRSYVSGVPAAGLHCEHGQFIPPVAPDSGKPLYIIYRGQDSEWAFKDNRIEHWIYAVFSYDDETNTFTLYYSSRGTDCTAYKKIHIVDANTVEVDRVGDSGSFEDGPHFTYEYKKAERDFDGWWNEWQDADGYEWQATYTSDGWVNTSEFNLIERVPVNISADKKCHNEVGLDGLFVFLVRKGNVGYAPPNTATLQYILAGE